MFPSHILGFPVVSGPHAAKKAALSASHARFGGFRQKTALLLLIPKGWVVIRHVSHGQCFDGAH